MTEAGLPGPSADSWVASVHAGERDLAPLGSAVVVDAHRVLTCAHVVLDGTVLRQPLWACFPKSDAAEDEWRLVESVDWAYEPPVTDVAVLLLDRDVPVGVEAAPVRCPRPGDLVRTGSPPSRTPCVLACSCTGAKAIARDMIGQQ